MGPQLDITNRLGSVPPPRPGNVAFLANLSQLLFDNRELTDELRRTVRTLESYGGRLLPIVCLLWEGDASLLAVESPPHAGLRHYFRDELGLRLPRLFGYDPGQAHPQELLDAIKQTPDCHLDGFVTDEAVLSLATRSGARLAGSVSGSRRGNNKVLLHRYLRSCGEPVFDSLEARHPDEVGPAVRMFRRMGYRTAVAKAAVGASGIGLVRFSTSSPPPIPSSHFLEGPCLIEGWLDENLPGIRSVASPSVQMVITDQALFLYDLTDQILSVESVHEGNVSPPDSFDDASLQSELLRQAAVAGNWLHHQGYRGTASTDFHLSFLHSGVVEVRICEVNARVTGATYPALMARHFLPTGNWLMRNLSLPRPVAGDRILEDLHHSGLLYHRDAAQGVLPINFNTDSEGTICKGQFLFLGPDRPSLEALIVRTIALQELVFTRD